MPLEGFMECAVQHQAPLHSGPAELEDHATPSTVTVVSNTSPLIGLAWIGHLDSLHRLYGMIHISTEVYDEVVIAGGGTPGAAAVANADWIRVSTVQDAEGLTKAVSNTKLGSGEVSTIFLAGN